MAISRTAKIPTSAPPSEVARAFEKAFRLFWSTADAVALYEKETKGPRAMYLPMPFEEWREMYDEEKIETVFSDDSLELRFPIRPESRSKAFLTFVESYAAKRGLFVKLVGKGHSEYTVSLETRRGVRVSDIPSKLYHVTRIRNVDRILRKGLLPRTPVGPVTYRTQAIERKYPERIYLTTSLAASVLIQGALFEHHTLSENSIEAVYGGNFEVEPYVTFEVSTSQLRRGTKFYSDPDFAKGGIYTYTEIPPSALRLLPESQATKDRWDREMAEAEAGDPYGRRASARRVASRYIKSSRILYHGTTEAFDRFDERKMGRRDTGNLGRGIYLTEDEDVARRYAEDNAEKFGGKPVVLKVRASTSRTADFSKFVPRLKELGVAFPPKAQDPTRSAFLREFFLGEGYDSVQSGHEVVVFDPRKLAILGSIDSPSIAERRRLILQHLREKGGAPGWATGDETPPWIR